MQNIFTFTCSAKAIRAALHFSSEELTPEYSSHLTGFLQQGAKLNVESNPLSKHAKVVLIPALLKLGVKIETK